MTADSLELTLSINGAEHAVRFDPRRTLADVLREDLGLTGTHVGCEHGVCGACTVLVDGASARSCLMLAPQAAGHAIQTIEGLTDGDLLHPLQQAFRDTHAFQCGFCTPGFVAAALELLEENPAPTEREVREAISGNVCRCTGYQNIVNAVHNAAAKLKEA